MRACARTSPFLSTGDTSLCESSSHTIQGIRSAHSDILLLPSLLAPPPLLSLFLTLPSLAFLRVVLPPFIVLSSLLSAPTCRYYFPLGSPTLSFSAVISFAFHPLCSFSLSFLPIPFRVCVVQHGLVSVSPLFHAAQLPDSDLRYIIPWLHWQSLGWGWDNKMGARGQGHTCTAAPCCPAL